MSNLNGWAVKTREDLITLAQASAEQGYPEVSHNFMRAIQCVEEGNIRGLVYYFSVAGIVTPKEVYERISDGDPKEDFYASFEELSAILNEMSDEGIKNFLIEPTEKSLDNLP